MEMVFFEFACCLVLAIISITQARGVFYKVDNLKLMKSTELIMQEDTISCAMESSCRHFTRALQANLGQPSLSVYFEKMRPGPDDIYSSCMEALYWNWNTNRTYRIRHDTMLNFIFAECRTVGSSTAAYIHHDNVKQIAVAGFESARSYSKAINYTNDLSDIRRFVDSSLGCRQFVRIDCKGMRLFDGSIQFAALIDRDNNVMKYIGGGPQSGRGCKCGITHSCHKSAKLCNCDTNDNVWRYDEGYVTDKQRLPLIGIRLGDTGDNLEQGKFIFGALECTEP